MEKTVAALHVARMITLRAPTQADIPALAALGLSTFVDTFGHLYAAEDLNAFTEQSYSIPVVEREMADPKRAYQVAEHDGALIGYCKLAFENTLGADIGGRDGIELKQLYIDAAHIGGGVAHRLMEWALGEARARKADDVVLSVWSGNARAQRFYQKYGFTHIGDTIFMVGNHQDEEFLYGLRLTA